MASVPVCLPAVMSLLLVLVGWALSRLIVEMVDAAIEVEVESETEIEVTAVVAVVVAATVKLV